MKTTNDAAAAVTTLYGLLAATRRLHAQWLALALREADSGALARELDTLSALTELIEELEQRAQGRWVVTVRDVPAVLQ